VTGQGDWTRGIAKWAAVAVLGGASRACHHGIDRIYPGTSRLVPDGGRINLTMRRVTHPGEA